MTTIRTKLGPRIYAVTLAAAVILRPALIAPMASSGPMRDTIAVPIGLGLLIGSSLLIGLGVLAIGRLMIAFAAITSVLGIVSALVGLYAGLPLPWPILLLAWNIGVTLLGIPAWREAASKAGDDPV